MVENIVQRTRAINHAGRSLEESGICCGPGFVTKEVMDKPNEHTSAEDKLPEKGEVEACSPYKGGK